MTATQYFKTIPKERKSKFKTLLDLIKSLYPTAELSMKYKMLTFTMIDGWVPLANQKNYISIYTYSEQHIASFKTKYPQIKTGKGCINFKDKDDLPLADIKKVVKSAMTYKK